MFHKLVALILLGLWLVSVHSGLRKNDNRDELSNRQQLINSNPLSVGHALSAHENKQKPPLGPISGVIIPHFAAGRVWSQRNRENSEHLKGSLKIYELNCVFLI